MRVRLSLYLFLAWALGLSACASAPPTPDPLRIPNGLSIEEYPLTQAPPTDSADLPFASSVHGDSRQRHVQERGQPLSFETGYCQNAAGSAMTMCGRIGPDEFVASAHYNWLGYGHVELQRNGKRIYSIGAGQDGGMPPLQGLWTYDGRWVLETAYISVHRAGDVITSTMKGRITVDGQLLNTAHRYTEAFSFQPLHDRPFFFYQRDSKIGASFEGVEIPLGYDELLHYGCCSGAALNPQKFRNMVAFYARRESTWYYVQIGVYAR